MNPQTGLSIITTSITIIIVGAIAFYIMYSGSKKYKERLKTTREEILTHLSKIIELQQKVKELQQSNDKKTRYIQHSNKHKIGEILYNRFLITNFTLLDTNSRYFNATGAFTLLDHFAINIDGLEKQLKIVVEPIILYELFDQKENKKVFYTSEEIEMFGHTELLCEKCGNPKSSHSTAANLCPDRFETYKP